MPLLTLRNAALLPFLIIIPYGLFITLLTIPNIQRNVLYANLLNPSHFQDLTDVEQFGFHAAQVVPFNFTPSDNPSISLYAWYMLPIEVYLQHENELKAYHATNSARFPVSAKNLVDEQTSPLHFLLSHPSAQLIISFHGNAAHLASSHRPTTYQHLLSLSTPARPVFVVSFDYRGFGLSAGTPTEPGLIADAVALLSLLSSAGIRMSRVTLLGQSLGTAVSTALYHHWTLELGREAPRALILLASFSSMRSVVDHYSVKGLTPPMLSGLDCFPGWVKEGVLGKVVDSWQTASRLADLWTSDVPLDLSLLHARDDREISWREGWRNFLAIRETGRGEFVTEQYGDEKREDVVVGVSEGKRVQWELVKHGGHNRVAVGEQMKGVAWRALNRGGGEDR